LGSRISVVVATYNYGKYLPRALDSILLQDRDDVEVFVVDDGSSDQTRTVVGQYGSSVHYIRQPHQGTFAACRTGVLASTGKWILFVDADDRLGPGAISALRAAASANPDAGLIVAPCPWAVRKLSTITRR
jgi:glycosyltransferase involved in cell wall biosynthesis